jgi:hypothetical protein
MKKIILSIFTVIFVASISFAADFTKCTSIGDDEIVCYADGSGPVSITSSGGNKQHALKEMRFHVIGGAYSTSESFTITIDSSRPTDYSTAYDTKIFGGSDGDMSGETDLVYAPEFPRRLTYPTDKFLFEFLNTDSSDWGLECIFK